MARRKRGGHAPTGGGGHGGAAGRWLVSYADFITLMFVVFTVLFSMARVDTEKYGALAGSLKSALSSSSGGGVLEGAALGSIPTLAALHGGPMPVMLLDGSGYLPDIPDWPAHLREPVAEPPPPADPPPSTAPPATKPEAPVTAERTGANPVPVPPDELARLEEALKTLPGFRSGLLLVNLEQSGLTLSVAANVLFDPGQTELRESAKGLLLEIIPQLGEVELPIWVYGTADENPVPGSLAPAFLSAMRSAAVITYFQEQGLNAAEFVNFSTSGGDARDYRVTIVVQRRR